MITVNCRAHQTLEQAFHGGALARIEAGQRLVEQQDARPPASARAMRARRSCP